jgi:hypothetical protein
MVRPDANLAALGTAAAASGVAREPPAASENQGYFIGK